MPRWEYQRAVTNVMDGPHERRKAGEAWVQMLNELGADGWELVPEHFLTGSVGGAAGFEPKYWAQYVGTLKRPIVDRSDTPM